MNIITPELPEHWQGDGQMNALDLLTEKELIGELRKRNESCIIMLAREEKNSERFETQLFVKGYRNGLARMAVGAIDAILAAELDEE